MEKKICNRCGQEKFLDEFHKNPTKKDGVQSMCKDCRKEYHREHYLKNTIKYKEKAQNLRDFLKELVRRYKQLKGCRICGEKRWWVLELHHRSKEEKDNNINIFVTSSNLKLLKKEIRKCDVLCSNCHKDLHYKQDWY